MLNQIHYFRKIIFESVLVCIKNFPNTATQGTKWQSWDLHVIFTCFPMESYLVVCALLFLHDLVQRSSWSCQWLQSIMNLVWVFSLNKWGYISSKWPYLILQFCSIWDIICAKTKMCYYSNILFSELFQSGSACMHPRGVLRFDLGEDVPCKTQSGIHTYTKFPSKTDPSIYQLTTFLSNFDQR